MPVASRPTETRGRSGWPDAVRTPRTRSIASPTRRVHEHGDHLRSPAEGKSYRSTRLLRVRRDRTVRRPRHAGPDQGVARDEPGQLFFVQILGTGGTHGEDHVADV